MRIFDFFFLFFLIPLLPLSFCLSASKLSLERVAAQRGEVTVDLREPLYSEGVLSTDMGGVVQAEHIRIQARSLRYTKKTAEGLWTLEASGDLMIEFGEYVFVGKELFYDFSSDEGVIYFGKTAVEPWFFGGERLELKRDKTILITNGYVTTSERDIPDWGIYAERVELKEQQEIKAFQVAFKAYAFTFLKIPALKANLGLIFDNPIRYRFRWGGRQGPRVGFTYELFSWNHWKMFLRFDWRMTRGPGAGIETYYRSEDRKTQFHSISYLAKDSSILHPDEKARYRFEGTYKKLLDEDKTSILLTFDKISDKDMPSVYYDRDFDFDTAERTQLRVRRQEADWIANFFVRARVNSFETVKQELPTLEINYKPFPLKKTGVIFQNSMNASFLNFEYSKYLLHSHNYSSSRFQYFPSLYRPFSFGPYCTATPEMGGAAIFYGNGPRERDQSLLQARCGLQLRSHLYRCYGNIKHVMEPYAHYRYFSRPTSSPHRHYIFDLSDGLTDLNDLSFGLNHAFYLREKAKSTRLFSFDLYSFAFFNHKPKDRLISRVYGKIQLLPTDRLRHTFDLGWNLQHQQIDFLNLRTEWTLNEDFALAAEIRHRGAYWWRKVDQENFFLDVFRTEQSLKHSQLSDRCNTFLLHLFYRLHPNWAFQFSSRYGWNRRHEPRYFEFECDLLTTIQTAWNVRLSYQHQQNDDRVALFLNIGLARPSTSKSVLETCSRFD